MVLLRYEILNKTQIAPEFGMLITYKIVMHLKKLWLKSMNNIWYFWNIVAWYFTVSHEWYI